MWITAAFTTAPRCNLPGQGSNRTHTRAYVISAGPKQTIYSRAAAAAAAAVLFHIYSAYSSSISNIIVLYHSVVCRRSYPPPPQEGYMYNICYHIMTDPMGWGGGGVGEEERITAVIEYFMYSVRALPTWCPGAPWPIISVIFAGCRHDVRRHGHFTLSIKLVNTTASSCGHNLVSLHYGYDPNVGTTFIWRLYNVNNKWPYNVTLVLCATMTEAAVVEIGVIRSSLQSTCPS